MLLGEAAKGTRAAEAARKVVEFPPKVVELLPEEGVVEIHAPPLAVCAPGGAFYVPEEVAATMAVCEDPSLGVPLREARNMSWEEIHARVEAIRQRYLAEHGN